MHKMKKVTIHQPEFLPWCGLIEKIANSDEVILYDLAQYNKQDFQNRNIVLCGEEYKYLTVPIQRCSSRTMIKDIRIANSIPWNRKISYQTKNFYHNAPFFAEIYELLSIIWEYRWESLCDLNVELIRRIMDYLEIDRKIVLSSQLVTEEELNLKTPSEKNLILCQKEHANIYVSGNSGKDYLDEDIFKKNMIDVVYHKYEKSTETNLSIVHYLFYKGKEAIEMIDYVNMNN